MKVVITRAREDSEEFARLLRQVDLTPVYFPTIKICPSESNHSIDETLHKLDTFDWIIFTSRHGANIFFDYIHHQQIKLPNQLKIAAVGTKTAAAILNAGHRTAYIPHKFLGESIVPGLGRIAGSKILLPTAQIADPGLKNAIIENGGIPSTIIMYRTLVPAVDHAGLEKIRSGVDYITFTSGSTVRNFKQIMLQSGTDPYHLPGGPKFVYIGPKSAAVGSEIGFSTDLVAEPSTVEAMVAKIKHNLSTPDK